MESNPPHVRSTGHGPSVILLHSSASSGRQWDTLVAMLQPRYRLHVVDLHGHGAAAAWNAAHPMRLQDELALVRPLLRAGGPVHLVGHSYGGALALKLAATSPDQVASVAVYEPVLFRLLLIVNWYNTEAAFGMFQGGSMVFTVLAFIVIGAIIYFYPQVEKHDWALRIAMSMQLAGAMGNLIDRLTQGGKVTDFISVGRFPVWNVADASITVGTIVLLVGVYLQERAALKAKKETAETQPAGGTPGE